MIGYAVISDRGIKNGLYFPDCMESIWANIPDATPAFIVDDSDHKLGMAGAVRLAWQWALDNGCDYLFHIEEDFRFLEPVPLDEMVYVLERAPHLAQVVLKRQPWNDEEKAAGGIVECAPDEYVECRSLRQTPVWTEHSRIFSLNPCLIPRRVLELGWPDENEAGFTRKCVENGYRFAFYGPKFAPPMVEHVGEVRSQGWRL